MRLGDEDDLPEGLGPKVREALLSETERPVDLAALRADDVLVEELAAGRMARVGAPARGTEDELVAMLAAWVADVRPAAAAHPLPDAPASETASRGAALPGTEHREPTPASVTPLGVPKHRAPNPSNPYGRRLAVAATLVVLGTSGLAIGASNAQPGEVLWPVSRVFYAERARSVEAAHEVNSDLEHARTALREGRSTEAAQAIAQAAAHLPRVRPAEGHAELARAQQLLLDALGTHDNGTGDPAPGTGTPTSPEAHVPDVVVPGGIHSPGEGARTPDELVYASPETGAATAAQPAAPGSADHLPPSAPAAGESSGAPADQPSTGGAPGTEAPVSSPTGDTPSSDTPSSESPSGTSDGQTPGGQTEPNQPDASDPASPDSSQPPSGEPNSQQSPDNPPSETQSEAQEQPPAESSPPPSAENEPSTPDTGGRSEQQQQDQSPPAADSQNFLPDEPANQPPANGDPGSPAESTNDQPAGAGSTDNDGSGAGSGSDKTSGSGSSPDNSSDSGRSSGSSSEDGGGSSRDRGSSNDDNNSSSSKDRGSSNDDNNSSSSKDRGSSNDDNNSSSSKDRGSSNDDNNSSSGDGSGAKSLISSVKDLVGSITEKD